MLDGAIISNEMWVPVFGSQRETPAQRAIMSTAQEASVPNFRLLGFVASGISLIEGPTLMTNAQTRLIGSFGMVVDRPAVQRLTSACSGRPCEAVLKCATPSGAATDAQC